ncbi:MAG: hypothetical protein IKW97_00935 [Muribaculaceae bacterium]|nr:hypothetical protein [Muribaculaceae bacterium]
MKKYRLFLLVGVIIALIFTFYIYILKDFQEIDEAKVRLGSNYFIHTKTTELLYGDFGVSAGCVVIYKGCIDYAFDDRWIIVKTKIPFGYHKSITDSVPSDSIIDYWIIDKSIKIDLIKYARGEETDGYVWINPNEDNWTQHPLIKSVTGPLDSISFYAALKEKAVQLSFKDRNN